MRKEKYYSTLINGLYIPDEFLERYNTRNNHKQFQIVCKDTSLTKADKYVQDILKITWKVFRPNYTSETGQQSAIVAADQFKAVIALDTYSNDYFDLKRIYDEVEEFIKSIKS